MAGDGAVSYEFKPVTRETLSDLARFSECHGRFRYCSCMRWRMRSSEFKDSTAEERAAALEALVKQGVPVGVLAYAGGEPVGWCSVAPRESYEALDRYKALQRIDAQPVWSVVCFFVDRRYRRPGGHPRPAQGRRRLRPVARGDDRRGVSRGCRIKALYLYGLEVDVPAGGISRRDAARARACGRAVYDRVAIGRGGFGGVRPGDRLGNRRLL